jgi:hypothetical protein
MCKYIEEPETTKLYSIIGIHPQTGRNLYKVNCPKIMNWIESCDKKNWEKVRNYHYCENSIYALEQKLEIILNLKF